MTFISSSNEEHCFFKLQSTVLYSSILHKVKCFIKTIYFTLQYLSICKVNGYLKTFHLCELSVFIMIQNFLRILNISNQEKDRVSR